MDIEKIIYLVALAVYGIFSTVLSIVRTLKTSKISSEVKAVLPPIDKQPADSVPNVEDIEYGLDDHEEHGLDDGRVATDYDGDFVLSPDEFSYLLSKIRVSKLERKK